MNFVYLALVLLLAAPSAWAQGTQLSPPGVKWGSGGVQVPTPTQQVGYDSGTGLPCIVGSTATCAVQVTATGGSGGTVAQGTAAAVGSAWPTTLVIGGALNAVGNPNFVAPGTGATWVLGAGSAIAAKFGIDQTTPGTTNGVNIDPTNASTAAIAPLSSSAAEASHILCAGPCNVYDVSATTGAVAGFLILWNATSAPANGAIAGGGGANQWTNCIQVPANGSVSLFEGNIPASFSTGAVILYSTTGCYNYTASATASFTWRVKS